MYTKTCTVFRNCPDYNVHPAYRELGEVSLVVASEMLNAQDIITFRLAFFFSLLLTVFFGAAGSSESTIFRALQIQKKIRRRFVESSHFRCARKSSFNSARQTGQRTSKTIAQYLDFTNLQLHLSPPLRYPCQTCHPHPHACF